MVVGVLLMRRGEGSDGEESCEQDGCFGFHAGVVVDLGTVRRAGFLGNGNGGRL
jgi:hypothetical protein